MIVPVIVVPAMTWYLVIFHNDKIHENKTGLLSKHLKMQSLASANSPSALYYYTSLQFIILLCY